MATLLLHNSGSAVNAADINGWTPLMFTSQNGHVGTAEQLIESGALINATQREGWTALMIASLNGNPDVARLLIEYGADCNVQGGDSGSINLSVNHLKTII